MNAGDIDGEIDSAIMAVALSLDEPPARQAFLERVFADREAAKEEMEKLLEASDAAAAFFLEAREQRAKVTAGILSEKAGAAPEASAFAGREKPYPDMPGPYRVVRLLGEGGGGVVYEAEQEEPIRRKVAVKILHVGTANERALARFDIERQALALMDHPNIAKVFDAGTTPAGKPFFAMELVVGESIVKYCDRHRLGCVARLELFIAVCNAIQHAHQKGVIHRDIKPTNVIVIRQDGVHVPKIIDFGIAKAAGSGNGREEPITAHDQFCGTPAYMSPEQVAMTGMDVDTRSDIFSLGVLLHELLTGTPPGSRASVPDTSFSQIRKSLLADETQRPSEFLARLPADESLRLARARSLEPGALLGFVKGDLDWIVMKALEKSRGRRYQTAGDLAADIRRFLAHQPILARPPSRAYVFAKFIRRNRIAFSMVMLLLALLVGGLATTAMLYEREKDMAFELLRLKDEAQEARDEEIRLRRQADARFNISRLAFMLNQGRIDEAEALRKQYPLSSIDPSLEAAAVFRSLGDWNAEHGHWEEALQCFKLLIRSNRQDNPYRILFGTDLIAAAAVALRNGEEEYVRIREEILAHYSPAAIPLHAEQLLKVCLIHPASPEVLDRLRRDVETLGNPRVAPHPAWSLLSAGLYQLRSGNFEAALDCSQAGLVYPECKSSCGASLEAVSAMAHKGLGRNDEGEAALLMAEGIVKTCEGRDFERGKQIEPYWFDWAVAELLIEEARSRVFPDSSGSGP